MLFVGSSSIRLWESLRTDFPNFKVINRGFGGSQFEDVNHYFSKIVAPYKPKKIVLYVGENDIDAKQTAENVLEDFKTFVALRDKNLPNTPIVFISLKPSILRWNMWAEMNKANNLIKEEIKKHRRVQFADLASTNARRGRQTAARYLHLGRSASERERLQNLARKSFAVFEIAGSAGSLPAKSLKAA